ncbi:L-histidine N(alpha)-methyltransferase [Aquincola sp. S2]|uniref:L-histidine N(Alpha)-methyltransferase n=1 Tax=Pseudaquabacterium terrae TaxID=2732868 RepID=A0ABX2ELV3_9BURK|nr:L-histidine N(alpha)-methyltransferase [Aquabacterium terrae]NRF69550.1 L-histidine N(alpha)-methyltransferase [Aquabacterium terrae]
MNAVTDPWVRHPLAIALLEGLRHRPRAVAPKYFYDAAGSALFDRICELPEYYPTRTETALLAAHAHEMAECIGPAAELVEYGAGSLRKIRLLLAALQRPARYLPIDLSAEHLQWHAQQLAEDHRDLPVQPLVADFAADIVLPPMLPAARRRVGFFPGSSIGNFTPDEARAFLQRSARDLRGGGLLIGVDLVKDPALLHRAYNDDAGVTAAFNKNLLARANRELGANFDLDGFHHYAFYDPVAQRIEMHLVSARRQVVRLCGESFVFEQGETLHTEISCKYTVDGFRSLAHSAGWRPQAVWVDPQQLFSVHWLAAQS